MDGWVDVWMDGWMDGWVDGWMESLLPLFTKIYLNTIDLQDTDLF